MIQNKVRHLLVVEDNDINRPLGIITPRDFTDYLKENLNTDDVNAKIIESLKEESISEHPITDIHSCYLLQLQTCSSYTNPQYKTILVPHDGSEMSDKALSHAIYLSNMSGAEILFCM